MFRFYKPACIYELCFIFERQKAKKKNRKMSWDIVLFSSEQNLISLENLDEDLLKPIDFDKVLKSKFENIKKLKTITKLLEKISQLTFLTMKNWLVTKC